MKVTKGLEGRYEVCEARVLEHCEGHYEAQEVPFGIVYRWCPGRVELGCGCGERLTLTSSRTTCGGCGADHAATVREELAATGRQGEDVLRPWRYAGDREGAGIPY